jgi:NitT/TauT family transport system permease protein
MRLGIMRTSVRLLLPVLALGASLMLHVLLPNVFPTGYRPQTYAPFLMGCLVIYLVVLVASLFLPALRVRLMRLAPLLAALFVLIEFWDVLTLKTGICRPPFLPSPDLILAAFVKNFPLVMECLASSMKLLGLGVAVGIITGLISGLLIGWSYYCHYWLMPVLKVIGPIPSALWLPLAMTIFPSSYVGCIFLISLAVWFPLTLMLSSSIRNTSKDVLETAQVLGAGNLSLLFRVAFPSSLPAVVNGIFAGIAASFAALTVVEMMGAESGLGYYIKWSAAWVEYSKVFGTVILMIIVFSLIMTIVMKIGGRLLKWQKGQIRW